MAQNPMMNPLQSAVLGPDVIAQQLRLQQRQQIGQQMLEQGSQAPQGQMVSGHYVAPSITQYLSQGLKGYLGQKALSELPKGMSDLAAAQRQGTNRLFGLTPQALASGLSAQPQEGATTQPGQPSPQSLGQGLGGATMPGIPGMSRQQQALIASQIGLPEYLKLAANKGGPVNVAPGGSLYNPQTGQVDYTAPKDGIAMQNGRAVAVPGFGDIQAQNAGSVAGAQAGAQAQYRFVDVPDGQGGTVKMREDQASAALGGGGNPQGQTAPGASGLGHAPAKQIIDARQDLPKVISQADSMISSIDGMLSHPGLSSAVGLRVPGATSIPGTEAANFQTRLDQLKGQAFLQAFQSLRGGGQITEVEGKKATDAIGRLSNNQSEAAFKESMGELRGILEAAKQRAYGMAGTPAPNAQSAGQSQGKAPSFDRSALEAEARRRGLIK